MNKNLITSMNINIVRHKCELRIIITKRMKMGRQVEVEGGKRVGKGREFKKEITCITYMYLHFKMNVNLMYCKNELIQFEKSLKKGAHLCSSTL